MCPKLQIRVGAYTAAAEAGIELVTCGSMQFLRITLALAIS